MSKRSKLMPNFSIKKAHQTQSHLSQKIITEDYPPKKIRTIAGDVSCLDKVAVGALAVLDYDSLKLLETQAAICKVKRSYIPTLLSFRETLPAIAAIKKLKLQPDVILVDAQGLLIRIGAGLPVTSGSLWVNRRLEQQKVA